MGIAFLNIPATKELEITHFCRRLGLRQWIELPHKKMYAWPQGTSTIIILHFKREVIFTNNYSSSLTFRLQGFL